MANIKKGKIIKGTVTIHTKPSCFVIMPFSKTRGTHTQEYWTNHYEKILGPLIRNNGFLPHRSEPLRGNIINQIINDLVTSPVVVADLTDANPNVYWELGVRQSFRHGTVTIAEIGTKLPFDIWSKGTLFYYPNSIIKNKEFEKQFSAALQHCLENPKSTDSHVLESISGRGTLYQIINKEESIRKLQALLSELERNNRLLGTIKELCKKNLAIKESKTGGVPQTPTILFIYSALDNLHVSRYLDADMPFYLRVTNLISWFSAYNLQLNSWQQQKAGCIDEEKWLVKNNSKLAEMIKELMCLVETHKKELLEIAG